MQISDFNPPEGSLGSPESERAVLATYWLEPATMDEHPTRAEHYADPRNRVIFEAMAALRADGETIDPRTIQATLELAGQWERAGGFTYFSTFDLDLPDTSRIDAYVRILEDRLLRRQIADLGRAAIRAVADGGRPAHELLADLQARFVRIGSDLPGEGYVEVSQVLAGIEQRIRTMVRGETFGLSTGLKKFDDIVGGFLPGNLIVLAGRPGHGKTSLALQMAEHQARQGVRVGFVSLEMTAQELGFRIISRGTGAASRTVSHNNMHDELRGAVYDFIRRSQGMPLSIDDRATARADQVVSSARRFALKEGAGVLYVDHLQLLGGAGRSRNEEIGKIAGDFKRLAKDLGLPVVLLSQLSRGAEKRGAESRPMLSELRDSGDIEAHADAAIFAHQPFVIDGNPANEGKAFLVVAKNRSGRLGEIDCHFDGQTTTFREIATGHGEQR